MLITSAVFRISSSGANLAPYISDAVWAKYVAMLILYVLTSLAVWLLFRLVAGVIDRVKLQEFDRQVGGLFGLAKGILLCLVITFFAVTLSESTRQAVLRTYSGRTIAVLIVEVRDNKVRLGFEAPADVQITRDDAHSLRPAPSRGVEAPQSAGNGPPCDRRAEGGMNGHDRPARDAHTPGLGGYVPRRQREGR